MRNHIQGLLGNQFPEVILGPRSSHWFYLLTPMPLQSPVFFPFVSTFMAGQSKVALQKIEKNVI